MTPSEREQRIEAGALAWVGRVGQAWTASRIAALILDAAEEVVPMVSPSDARITVMAHYKDRAERAEAAARDFADRLAWIAEVDSTQGYGVQARDVLARHPSFSGEEGTEG